MVSLSDFYHLLAGLTTVALDEDFDLSYISAADAPIIDIDDTTTQPLPDTSPLD